MGRLLVGDQILNLREYLFDEVFAHFDQIFVQIVALDQEHGHSDLIGCDFPNSCDSFLVAMDLRQILLTLRWFFRQESLESCILVQQEQEFVVDVDAFSCRLKVLIHDLFDFKFGFLDDFVFQRDKPKL